MSAKSLMVLGSMSSAGKSLLVTGLCRLYARRGWKMAPFKAQNMSNNAAVCAGGEIGRAQAVQARAAGIEPSVEMNPVLLKPEADSYSQVILRGQVWKSFSATDYYQQGARIWQAVTESIDYLKEEYDLVIMEGAGSPAEINLQKNDIVNLAAARYAQAPCLLAGDIDRGGVFAQLLGTLWLLEEEDRKQIRGLIVNKFRGDIDLFKTGIRILEERGGVPVLGVVPYIKDHGVAEEDAASLVEYEKIKTGALDIAVIHLPHISNFDDLDPLRFEPEVSIRFIRRAANLGNPAVIILPGTKNTLDDLQWLHETGLANAIQNYASAGGVVVGLCGGFQIIGNEVFDDQGVESGKKRLHGLGLLRATTRFEPQKTVTRSKARIIADSGFLKKLRGEEVIGYEIHMGQTTCQFPMSSIEERESQPVNALDGAYSPDAKIWGTYLHGIFENNNFRAAWLENLGVRVSPIPFAQHRQQAYDHLADVLEKSLDISLLDRIIQEGV